MGEVYSSLNGVVCFTYVRNDVNHTAGLVDHGTSGEIIWDVPYGGVIAFGPSKTIYVLSAGQQGSVYALSVGELHHTKVVLFRLFVGQRSDEHFTQLVGVRLAAVHLPVILDDPLDATGSGASQPRHGVLFAQVVAHRP